jgi:hypothetical protein
VIEEATVAQASTLSEGCAKVAVIYAGIVQANGILVVGVATSRLY